MKYFHSSPKKFKPGDIIGRHDLPIFMTQDPNPHYTILTKATIENWNVYEVRPISKVHLGKCWDELVCNQVEVIKRIGSARGISKNSKPNFKEKESGWGTKGSRVFWGRDFWK